MKEFHTALEIKFQNRFIAVCPGVAILVPYLELFSSGYQWRVQYCSHFAALLKNFSATKF